ncbi:MAG: DUF2911 domain-containing protein [Acidobacteriota bacterium]
MKKKLLLTSLFTLMATAAFAQHDMKTTDKKPLSPPAKTQATLNGKAITIDYSAPSKRNRPIMGTLVPYGKVWRTGANSATSLKTEGSIEIGTLVVPAGSYTLYTLPGEKDWTLIVNKQTGQWGTEYDEKQDLGRVTMNVSKLDKPVETFVIDLKPTGNKAVLSLKWENTEASVPVSVHR